MRVCRFGLVLFVLSGCTGYPGKGRAASFEVAGKDGTWQFEQPMKARLDLDGWAVRIVESRINVHDKMPRLELLVIEIENTSKDKVLVLEPKGITLADARKRMIPLGPSDRVILEPAQSKRLSYHAEIISPLLHYPVPLTVTVFRGVERMEPQKVTIRLR